ncbi:MAG: hypothetical protein R3212_14115 [Xanthomonadales bacterium]|nr:hypothetical protein [Xanthomonadales bacterium]
MNTGSRGLCYRAVAILAMALISNATFAQDAKGDWNERLQAETDIDRLGRLYLELLLEEDPTGAASVGIHGRGDDDYYYDRLMPDGSAVAR